MYDKIIPFKKIDLPVAIYYVYQFVVYAYEVAEQKLVNNNK